VSSSAFGLAGSLSFFFFFPPSFAHHLTVWISFGRDGRITPVNIALFSLFFPSQELDRIDALAKENRDRLFFFSLLSHAIEKGPWLEEEIGGTEQ